MTICKLFLYSRVNKVKSGKMFTKEEAKEIRVKFWEGFKRYCKRKHIYRKWVLTGVKIPSVQLKFYVDR